MAQTDFVDMLGALGNIFDNLVRNRRAEQDGIFDADGLIAGYDTFVANGTPTYGMPRRPHMACLLAATSSTALSKLNFRRGAMSVTELVIAFYQALRLSPLDSYRQAEVDILLTQLESPYRDRQILDIYRETDAEKAIRTIILIGPCDLAEYIVALRASNAHAAQLLTARSFRPLLTSSLPGWEIRKELFGARSKRDKAYLDTDGLRRCYVDPLNGAALLAELTRVAQNIIAHAWRALSKHRLWLTRKALHDDLIHNHDLDSNSIEMVMAAAMGMEPLIFTDSPDETTNLREAAKVGVAMQIDKIERLAIGEQSLHDFVENVSEKVIGFPIVDAAPALKRTLPQTEAVRTFGLTLREHIDYAFAWLYDEARIASDEIRHIPLYPGHAFDIGEMSHGSAMWYLATQWLANVGDDVSILFAKQARVSPAQRPRKDDKGNFIVDKLGVELPDEINSVHRPIKSDEHLNRGKNMLETGRFLRRSDVEAGTACADARYDFRFWLRSEDALHKALEVQAKPMLSMSHGTGLGTHVSRLPQNISIRQHGISSGQKTKRITAADKQALHMLYAVAHDTMLMPCGIGLSNLHIVLRSYSQRLHEAEVRDFIRKTPGNFVWANRPNTDSCPIPAIFECHGKATSDTDSLMFRESRRLSLASVIGSALYCFSFGGKDEPAEIWIIGAEEQQTRNYSRNDCGIVKNFRQAAIDLAHFEK